MDNTTYSYAAAILAIDLSGQTDVELDFWWREFGDEVQAEEGVYISDAAGATWFKVYSFDGDTTSWHNAIVDIDAEAAANSLALNDRFQIKFQFYDNYPIDADHLNLSDGYAIDEVRVHAPPNRVYLPALFKNTGPPESAPVLSPIDNPTGDYDYTVSWGTVSKATQYTLEEDDNADFSSPTTAYQGTGLSKAITGKDLGTYYYRVKASNEYGESDWSNVESTTVTTEKPPGPETGSWSGSISPNGYPISFTVSDTSGYQVKALTIKYQVNCTYGWFVATTTFFSAFTITNDHFDTGGSAPRVWGDFTSTTTASGNWSYSEFNPIYGSCYASGTWSATHSP